jgi:hypothetical protein
LSVLRTPPGLYDTKHETSPIGSSILTHTALSGVMKDAIDDAVDGSIWVDALIVPASD